MLACFRVKIALWINMVGQKRLLLLAATCLVLGGIWWHLFYTDKRSATEPVEVPLGWLGEDILLTGERGRLFIRTSSTTRIEIYALEGKNAEFGFGDACIGSHRWWFTTSTVLRKNGRVSSSISKRLALPVEGLGDDGIPKIGTPIEYDWRDHPMLPSCEVDLSSEATSAFLRSSESFQNDRSIQIDGEPVRLEYAGGRFAQQVEGSLFLDRDPVGLIHLIGDSASRFSFPQPYADTLKIGRRLNWGEIIWDRSLGHALFIHNTCSSGRTDDPECRRKALWLTPDLEPLSTVEMPGKSLIKIKPGYSCFSCGCGCYSHEQIYAENGVIYAHVWGYPVENNARGIYRLLQTQSGPTWEKLVSGRPQAPLAFNPRGDRVAFFEISRLGDELRIAEISKQP